MLLLPELVVVDLRENPLALVKVEEAIVLSFWKIVENVALAVIVLLFMIMNF